MAIFRRPTDQDIAASKPPEPRSVTSLGQVSQTPLESPVDRRPTHILGIVFPDETNGIVLDRNNRWTVDVKVKDPVTGETVLLQGIPLEDRGGTAARLHGRNRVYVYVPDPKNIYLRDTTGMVARFIDDEVRTENTAIPVDTLYRNFRSRIDQAKRELCNKNRFNFREEARRIGRIRGITVLQDTSSGRSPGILVDNASDEVVVFTRSQSTMKVTQSGVHLGDKEIDEGVGTVYKSSIGTLGLPGVENEMQYAMPRSNILLNIPMIQMPYWPSYVKIMNGITMLYRFVRMVEVCRRFLGQRNEDAGTRTGPSGSRTRVNLRPRISRRPSRSKPKLKLGRSGRRKR